MKTSKLLITSLLAAAAMSAPAWAANDVTVSGSATADGAGTFTITSNAGDSFSATASKDSTTGLWTYKTSAMNNRHITIGTVSIDADTTLNIYTPGPSDVKFTSATQLTGSGTLILNRDQDGVAVSSIYKIESDANLSNFTGTIEVLNQKANKKNAALWLDGSAANATISLSTGAGLVVSGTNVSVAGLVGDATSSLRSQNTVRYNADNFSTNALAYAGDNSGTAARTLTIGGSGAYSFAGSVGSATNQSLLNLTKSGTGTQTLSGTTYLGNLEVSGGNLVLSGTANIAGTTTVTGGTLDLSGGTITLANAIQNSGTVTVSDTTVFNLTTPGVDVTLISGGTIVGVDWNSLTNSNFTYNGAAVFGRGLTSSSVGVVHYNATATAKTLTWNGGDSAVWKAVTITERSPATPWLDGSTAEAFYNGDSVTFNTANASVEVSGTVNPAAMTVSAATSFTGTGTISTESLTANASLTLNSGVTLAVTEVVGDQNDLRDFSKVYGAGTLSVALNTVNGQGVNASNLTGTLYVSGDGRLQLNQTTLGTGASIEMASGADLVLNAAMASFSHDIKINGTTELYFNGSSSNSVDFSGDITGAGTLSIASNGNPRELVLSGNVDLGGISVGTNKSLTLSGTAKFGSISASGRTVTVDGGSLTIGGAATTFASSSSVSIGSLNMKTGASATQTSGIVTISGDVRLHTSDAATTETYTLSGGVLNITKTASLSIAADTTTDPNYNASAILLGVWKRGEGQLAVQGGTLNVLNSQVVVGFDSSAEVAMSSGEMNVKGVALYGKNSGKTSKLTVTGGRLNIGSEGLITSTASTSYAIKTISISDATVGSLDSWSANGSITLGGMVTFDTTKMVASTTGKSSADATDTAGTTITLNGVLSGDGALKKTGAGKLTLSNANIYTGGTVIEAGTVVAAHASALGTTKGVEVQSGATLKLGTDAVTVAGLSGAGTVGLADGRDSATLTVNGGGVFTGTLSRGGDASSLALVFDADKQTTLELNPTLANDLSSVDIRAGTVKTGNALGLGHSANVTVQSLGTLEFTTSNLTTKNYGLMLIEGGITFKNGASFVVDVTGAATDVALSIITSSVIKFYNGSEDVSLTSDNLDQFVDNFVKLKGWDGLADWAYDGSKLSLTMTIPEPSMFGLLAGLGALALAGTRRRRRK